MNRTPLLVGALFIAVVGAGAIWLGPRLLRRPTRTTAPRVAPPSERAGVPPPERIEHTAPVARPPSKAPAPRLLVTTPDGASLPSAIVRQFAGTADPRGFAGKWVGAKGYAWTRLPPTDADGAVRVRLNAVAPELVVTVNEADSSPAAGVLLTSGGDGLILGITGPDGRLRVDAMAAGVLDLRVGQGARGSSVRRVRMGVEREVGVVLEPGWAMLVHVVNEAGSPLAGADVAAYGFDGPRTSSASGPRGTEPIRSGADGVARFVTRVDERLAIVASADGFETTTVRAPWPDPRAPLSSDMTIRMRKDEGRVAGSLHAPAAVRSVIDVRAEPAVLAPLREWFGREDVVERSTPVHYVGAPAGEDSPIGLRGLDRGVPWRVTVRGSVIAEDHVLDLDDSSSQALRLRPEASPPDAGPVADSAAKPEPHSLRGRVTDVKGAPLRGITVGADGRRAVTDADGLFVVPGVAKGEALDVVYGWLDGADSGAANPADFAPWFQVRASASDDLLSLTLPRAASARFRLTDGLSGKPISWARVLILDGDGSVRFDAPVATSDGRVTLDALLPGTAGTLLVFAPGLRREVPLALRAGETTDAGEVGLIRGGRVTGSVKDRAGALIAGAGVAVMEDGRLERGGRSIAYGRDLVMRRTTTDEKGAFVLEGLDTSRPAAIGISADGYAPAARRVLWTEGEDAPLSATLLLGGSVRLQLFEPTGARVSGALVDLEDARTGVRMTDLLRRATLGSFVASTEDVRRATKGFLLEDPKSPGIYRIGPVEAGPYDVVVSCPGFQTKRAKFSVPDPRRSIPAEALEWRLDLTPTADGK